MDKLPKDWKVMKLSEILTGGQADEVCKILNTSHRDQDQLIRHLKKYLSSIRSDLEAKGVDPCYLAYYLAHNITRASQGFGLN